MISFKVTGDEARLIGRISKRAVEMAESIGVAVDPMTMNMDITACHCNGCPLRLREMLEADDANFSHDVFGIRRHIDRKTGQLGGCFLPRFAKPDSPKPGLAKAGLAVVERLLDEHRSQRASL